MKNSFCSFLIVLLLLSSCDDNNTNSRANHPEVTPTVTKPISGADDKLYQDVYTLNDLGLSIVLAVTPINDSLEFSLIITETETSEKTTITGIAMDKSPDMDPELDEDETGTMFPAEEFSYNNNGCDIYIRISSDASIHRAKVNVISCTAYPPVSKISGLLLK